MTIHPDQCCDKRESGSILLELNIMFMVMVIVSAAYCNAVQVVLKNCRRLLADIEIAKAARYTESTVSSSDEQKQSTRGALSCKNFCMG